MQDIIKKIIEIDQRAQKMTDEALAMKAEAEAAIVKDKQALREQYIERARKRISTTTAVEEDFLKESLAEIDKRFERVESQLKSSYEQNHEKWAGEIYERVLKA